MSERIYNPENPVSSPMSVVLASTHCESVSAASARRVDASIQTPSWRLGLFCLMLVALFTSGLKPASAATYYVATWGSDGNPGSQSAPFRTIGKGVGVAAAGDTVYLRGGTFVESVTIGKSGSAGAPIKLHAYPGEYPVIDGQNYLPYASWTALIYITGNYIDVSGIQVQNSKEIGVALVGHHNSVHWMNVHHAVLNGIIVRGDYGVVEDSRVWQTVLQNYQGSGNGMWASALSAARDPVNGITDGASLVRNVVYNNWGEGMSSYEASGTVMQDNVVYDNWAVNFYISDSTNVWADGNMIYTTANNPVGRRSCGLCLADETSRNPSNNITITNNIVYQTGGNLKWWSGYSGSGMRNVLVAHNTFVNTLSSANIAVDYGSHSNLRIVNNLVRQDDSIAIAWLDSRNSGISFNSNLWSKAPPYNASAWDDVIANPMLAQAGNTGPGQLTGDWFKPASSSPAIDNGVLVSNVTADFFGNARGTNPDLGAVEFGASAPPSPSPSPTPTPPAGETNLALNKPAVASTTENGTNVASKAFDGNLQTRWSSQYWDPQWIYVDLGANYQINRVKLAWEAAYDRSFQIQVSTDLVNWTTIYTTTTGKGGTQDLSGLSGLARYVKMQGLVRATSWGHSILEMEVYGTAASTATTNLALNKPVTVSSTENGSSNTAQKLVDGNAGTRWSSQYWDPQWVTIDLGSTYNISRVKLLWEAAYARSYKIRVSTNGTTWTDIWSTTTGSGGTVDLNSLSGTGRYLQIYGDARATGWGYSLWEAEVYGTPSAAN